MKTSVSFYHWAPRIMCILAILFVSMFALDSFTPGQTIWQQLAALFMHLIPSFILLGILILAWKKEFIGGIFFVLVGLGFIPFIYSHNYAMNHSFWMSLSIVLIINFPFIVIGILFLISNYLSKKNLSAAP